MFSGSHGQPNPYKSVVEIYGCPKFVERVPATKAKKKRKALILFKPLLRKLQRHTLENSASSVDDLRPTHWHCWKHGLKTMVLPWHFRDASVTLPWNLVHFQKFVRASPSSRFSSPPWPYMLCCFRATSGMLPFASVFLMKEHKNVYLVVQRLSQHHFMLLLWMLPGCFRMLPWTK